MIGIEWLEHKYVSMLKEEKMAGTLEHIDADDILPDRTPEEIIANAVATNPRKHGAPVDLLKHRTAVRALREARREAGQDDDWQELFELRCRQLGIDADAMLPGNKPRFTMDEQFSIKDHETGEIYPIVQVSADATAAQQAPVEVEEVAQDEKAVPCAHQWPKTPDAETRCPDCGMTFQDWVES